MPLAPRQHYNHGAVSNIINELTNALGKYETDALRELAKSLRLPSFSPAQCAIGFRTIKILSEHGIDGETAQAHCISDTYKKCKDAGVTTSKIVNYIEELNKFSIKFDYLKLKII